MRSVGIAKTFNGYPLKALGFEQSQIFNLEKVKKNFLIFFFRKLKMNVKEIIKRLF